MNFSKKKIISGVQIKRSSAQHEKQKRMPTPSVICKLKNREIFGICCRSKRSRCAHRRDFPLAPIPSRLAIPLSSIIDKETLCNEGHVFLGFSSCDQFLISYTEKLEEANQTGFISHSYILHWWIFNVSRNAELLGSVELFANEEIECSLYLCYAEWPNDKSQVIIYGWRKSAECCYITITSVPSLNKCEQCNICSIENTVNGSHTRCMSHGFTAHLKQVSGTSRYGVLNSSGLNIDGILVLNIGHSIVINSTGIVSENDDIEQLPLSSIKRAACEESVTDSELARALRNDEQLEEKIWENTLPLDVTSEVTYSGCGESHCLMEVQNDNISQDHEETLQQRGNTLMKQKSTHGSHSNKTCTCNSMFVTSDMSKNLKTSVYDMEDHDDITCIRLTDKSKISAFDDKENQSKFHNQSQIMMSNSEDLYFDCKTKRNNIDKFLNIVQTKFEDDIFEKRTGETAKSTFYQQTSPIKNSENTKKSHIPLSNNSKCTSGSAGCMNCNFANCRRGISANPSVLPSSSSMQNESDSVHDLNFCIEYKRPANKLPTNKFQCQTDSVKSLELGISNQSPSASVSSGSMFCSAESQQSQGFSRIVNENKLSEGLISFSESYYGPIPRDSISSDDRMSAGEGGLWYCSMSCQGAAGEIIYPLKSGQGPIHAYSQHLVLDLEHVIFDILRTRCYNAYKYGYLVDYETNIIDVCRDTKCVVLHIAALLNIAPNRSQPLGELGNINRAGATIQQAEFILCWRLHTGRYEVVIARPLKYYDEQKLGKWQADWLNNTELYIKKQCSIKSHLYRSVYILDNSAVFRRRSLNVLWNCDKTLVVTK